MALRRRALSMAGLGHLLAMWPLNWATGFLEGPAVHPGCPTGVACRAWSPAQICVECFFLGRDFQLSRREGRGSYSWLPLGGGVRGPNKK